VRCGRTSTGDLSRKFDLSNGDTGSGVATRWARARVASLMDELHAGGDPAAVRSNVVATGLEHHLVTQYTSLVAVEEIVTAQGPARGAKVANALPHGSQLLSGTLPKGGTDGPLRQALGWASCVLGAAMLALRRRMRRRGEASVV